jgi:hypothetical protein
MLDFHFRYIQKAPSTRMSLFANLLSIFKKKPEGYATPWMVLHVVHAIAADGLTADQAYGLRARFLKAGAIDFSVTIKEAVTTYTAYFRDTETGLQRCNALVDALRSYKTEYAVPVFGIGTGHGECIVEKSDSGGFETPPVGEAVTKAVRAARIEAGVEPGVEAGIEAPQS